MLVPVSSSFSSARSIVLALLCGAALSASACGSSGQDPWYLGPLDQDAGAPDTAPTPDAPAPTPSALSVTVCNSAPVLGSDVTRTVRAVATLESRGVLTLEGTVRAVQLDADGCPGAPVVSFGEGGDAAIDASDAVLLPGGRTLVASGAKTVLLDSTASELGSCTNVSARVLDAQANGLVAAAFTRSPIALLTTNVEAPASCGVTLKELSPAPFAVVAIGRGRADGFVSVEQGNAASPLVVARYAEDGQRLAISHPTGAKEPGWLCSASGMADTPVGVAVADATCNRVVLFEAKADTMVPVGVAELDGSPRGLALTPSGSHLLVPVAKTLSDGAMATFMRVALP